MQAQTPGQVQTAARTISLYQYADSVTLFELPENVTLRSFQIRCDTAISGGDTDSIKIGIQGESAYYKDSFRFADIPYDSLTTGDVISVSHTHFRQDIAGKLFLYEAEQDVVCTDVGTFYPLKGMRKFVFGDMDTSLTQSALIIRKYCDGWYDADFNVSFSASKAATALVELFKDGNNYNEIAIERTISTGNQVGAASARGGVYLVAGDSVGVYFESSAASTTYTVHQAQLNLKRFNESTPYRTGASAKNIMLYCGASTGRFTFIIEYLAVP